jgi:creatinine amidohydrolase
VSNVTHGNDDRPTDPPPPPSRDLGSTAALPAGLSRAPRIDESTTEELSVLLQTGQAIALVPVGSTEPHGPHLPLGTDAFLSEQACMVAAMRLLREGRPAVVAPTIAFGVTKYAAGFAGAIGIRGQTLIALLCDLGRALLDEGFGHVCFVNNHLEPAHVQAVRSAVDVVAAERGPSAVSFPNQLTKRWGRTLTDEFKSGACHAGRYETSLVEAARPELVRPTHRTLPAVPISLSEAIKSRGDGAVTFAEIGMTRAYCGAPAEASREEGVAIYDRLAEMIVTEINEHIADAEETTDRGPRPQNL